MIYFQIFTTFRYKSLKNSDATSNTFSKARRTADSIDCGQPPVVRDAF